jgi:phosphoglycolate phosphatase
VDAYRRFVGSGVRVLAERATEGLDADIAALVQAFRTRYHAHPVTRTRPYEGVQELLDELRDRDLALGVLSNKPHALTTRITAELFPASTFRAVWGKKDGFPPKPDPTLALVMLEALGLAPEACAYVGDTDVDMLTAKSSGMLAVGVLWGFRDEQELRGAGAARVIAQPRDLLEVVTAPGA